jgi:hypothetical protein
MGAATIQQMALRVAELMQEKLKIKGRTLDDKLRAAGRRLPKPVKEAAHQLALAAEQAKHPKLVMRIDEEAVAQNYDTCVRDLNGLDKWYRRRGIMLSLTLSILLSLLGVVVLLLIVLRWRGFL